MDHQAFAQLLGNYGEFFGAIAVVASLIYLAVQIRQNTHQMRRTQMDAGAAQFSVPRMAIVTDRGLAELFVKASETPDDLDAADLLRLDMLSHEAMWAFFHTWDRARFGSIDREDWDSSARPAMEMYFAGEVVRRWWESNKQGFPQAFRAEVESIIDQRS